MGLPRLRIELQKHMCDTGWDTLFYGYNVQKDFVSALDERSFYTLEDARADAVREESLRCFWHRQAEQECLLFLLATLTNDYYEIVTARDDYDTSPKVLLMILFEDLAKQSYVHIEQLRTEWKGLDIRLTAKQNVLEHTHKYRGLKKKLSACHGFAIELLPMLLVDLMRCSDVTFQVAIADLNNRISPHFARLKHLHLPDQLAALQKVGGDFDSIVNFADNKFRTISEVHWGPAQVASDTSAPPAALAATQETQFEAMVQLVLDRQAKDRKAAEKKAAADKKKAAAKKAAADKKAKASGASNTPNGGAPAPGTKGPRRIPPKAGEESRWKIFEVDGTKRKMWWCPKCYGGKWTDAHPLNEHPAPATAALAGDSAEAPPADDFDTDSLANWAI